MKKNYFDISDQICENMKKKGLFLKEMRKSKGYTQKELASLVKTVSTYISAIETGKRSCGKYLAVKLASIFKCNYEEFL